jgi:molybdopterin-binding protein
MTSFTLLTPRQAVGQLGMSYPAPKHWILAGRIPVSALSKFLPAAQVLAGSPRIGGRNQLVGTVTQVKIEGLLAKVALAVGEQRITAIITADAARDLALRPGDQAIALIRATEVMIVRP